MSAADEFSGYLGDLIEGRYDCVDRIALRAYFPLGQSSGGLLRWWNQLYPDQGISELGLRRMAGDFARRVKAFSAKEQIPLQYCELGQKGKHLRAEKLRPKAADFQGVFLILVARAPAPVWQVYKSRRHKVLIRRPKSWPLVNHYHFHIVDKQWGQQRLAGVDIQKARLRAVAQALIALAPQPDGFTAEQLAARVRSHQGPRMPKYNTRKAAYDLRKFRGKNMVRRIAKSRRYRVQRPGIRTLAALLILRERVLKPVMTGVCRPIRSRPPKNIHSLDLHYQALQREMLSTLQDLKLAA
jgi:hypothetical protein